MSKLEQMKEQKFYQYLQVAGFHREAEQFITEVWNEAVEETKIKNKETIEYYQLRARNEAIKECERCVPEPKDVSDENVNDLIYRLPLQDGDRVSYTHVNYDERKGHNSCREQTLQAIRQMYE